MVTITFKGSKNKRVRINGIELKYGVPTKLPEGMFIPDIMRNSNEFEIKGEEGAPVSAPKPSPMRVEKSRIKDDKIKS